MMSSSISRAHAPTVCTVPFPQESALGQPGRKKENALKIIKKGA